MTKLNEDDLDYLKAMTHQLNWALTSISRGRVWIDWFDDKDTVKLTCMHGHRKNPKSKKMICDDLEMAQRLQLMFHNAVNKKAFDVKGVQEALDYYKWDIKLVKEKDSVLFKGKDCFLMIQISFAMGAMTGKQYAQMVRNAYKAKERVFF